jgi:hypothetical protein
MKAGQIARAKLSDAMSGGDTAVATVASTLKSNNDILCDSSNELFQMSHKRYPIQYRQMPTFSMSLLVCCQQIVSIIAVLCI